MKRYVVVISNSTGTFRAEVPVRAENIDYAIKLAMQSIGERTPALGTLRVVSVHERGDV